LSIYCKVSDLSTGRSSGHLVSITFNMVFKVKINVPWLFGSIEWAGTVIFFVK